MDHLLTPSDMAALAIRMARVHTPEHHIALMLGLAPKTLRALYGPAMERAKMSVNLEIRETLFAMAKSGKHVAATIYCFKTFASSVTEKPSAPSKTKPTVSREMPPYGTIQFVGPNGEIVE